MDFPYQIEGVIFLNHLKLLDNTQKYGIIAISNDRFERVIIINTYNKEMSCCSKEDSPEVYKK